MDCDSAIEAEPGGRTRAADWRGEGQREEITEAPLRGHKRNDPSFREPGSLMKLSSCQDQITPFYVQRTPSQGRP